MQVGITGPFMSRKFGGTPSKTILRTHRYVLGFALRSQNVEMLRRRSLCAQIHPNMYIQKEETYE